MSQLTIGLIIFLFLGFLLAVRTPIAISLLVAGAVGYTWLDNANATLNVLAGLSEDLLRGYSFSVIPLFVLMGIIAGRSSMASKLYEATRILSRKGARASLATATIGSCAVFGAICGSSIATAATMTPIAMPEMKRYGYETGFSASIIAAGGTLGILIPPSVILIIYALLAEQSILTLFAAALPLGVLLAIFCVFVAKFLVFRTPELAPEVPVADRGIGEKLKILWGTWRIAVVFGISLGGIYLGWFSPTEAAAAGAGLAFLLAVGSRELNWRDTLRVLDDTLMTSAQIFFIFIGGLMFARFVALTQIPINLADWVVGSGIPGPVVIIMIVVLYIFLGCVLETVSMILVTVPVFLPLITGLGYDPVWFGLLVVIVAEMGLITPPVGLNIFVIRSQLPDVSLGKIFRSVTPFLSAHLALIFLMMLLPDFVNWFPKLLGVAY